jgi:hypothetical protein
MNLILIGPGVASGGGPDTTWKIIWSALDPYRVLNGHFSIGMHEKGHTKAKHMDA